MSAQLVGGPFTVAASAKNLTTGLGLSARIFVSTFALRADPANVGTVWIGKSNVTTTTNQMGFLRAGEALTIDMHGKFITSDDLYMIGTVADKVYVLDIS